MHPNPNDAASKAKPVVQVEFTQEEINAINMAVSAYIRRGTKLAPLLKAIEQRLFAAHALFGPLPGLSLRPHPRPQPRSLIDREGMKERMMEEIAEEEKE